MNAFLQQNLTAYYMWRAELKHGDFIVNKSRDMCLETEIHSVSHFMTHAASIFFKLLQNEPEDSFPTSHASAVLGFQTRVTISLLYKRGQDPRVLVFLF